jgi:hypothetical protein
MKKRRIARVLVACVCLAAASAAWAITESRCKASGGTPQYREELTTSDECGFVSDFLGWCTVGETTRTYTGCRYQ